MSYRSKIKSDDADALMQAIMLLDNEEDCYRFFEDLCTINEIHSMAQRWQVAKLLDEGNTYTAIEEQTKASTATISRINKCLGYGSEGYRRVLDKMK